MNEWLDITRVSFRVQALALAVVVLLIIDYLKSKKLPLRSTLVFRYLKLLLLLCLRVLALACKHGDISDTVEYCAGTVSIVLERLSRRDAREHEHG